MSFLDLIKNSVIKEFTGTITVGSVMLAVLISFIIALFIVFIYRKTFTGVVYSKSFVLCIILLSMITALIIKTISSNLALSLGMVGALSIVRFRTAVKEPVDTAFMFWAIAAGIMSGAGLYLIALIGSLILGVIYYISFGMGFKFKSQYLLVLRYNLVSENEIVKRVHALPKYKLKSKSFSKNIIESTYEIELFGKNKKKSKAASRQAAVALKGEDESGILYYFKDIEGLLNVSLISYQNDFGE
ncbi:MAG: DUF4956 domain-containing protein [Eubacteriaceae bacterium]